MGRILAAAAATSLAALLAAQGASAEAVGFVAVTQGDVQIQHTGTWKAAARDAEVEIGDAIRTGTGARAKIVLVDDTLLQIDEETELRIETFHVGDAATKEVSIVRQARGRLRTTVGDAFGGSTRIEVHVPTAAVGVKGTDFEVIQDGLWEACLHSGGIRVSNSYGSADPGVGECVYAYGDKAPGDPHPNPRTPLEVGNGGGDGGDEVAERDFEQPIEAQVGAGGGDPEPPGGGGDGGNGGYDGSGDEDELQIFDVPEVEPPPPDVPDIIINLN